MMVGFADETVVGAESVGARLRSAREAHGLSLDDIAARTRVPTRHLKAIEDDAFDQLPAAPYSVGFAKAFADAVGLNREEIGREFRAEKEGYGASDAGPSYISDEPSPSSSGGLVRIALILAIIAAIAFGLWKSGLFSGSSQVATPAVAPPAAPEAALPVPPPAVETSNATEEQNGSQANDESSARTKSSNEDENKGEKRPKSDKGDESGNSQSSTNQSEPAATSEPERASPKTTRQLNEEAAKAAVPASGTSSPAAAPPVIAPPPPAATPAAPAATP
jgi:cytoskeleton protein RodZ